MFDLSEDKVLSSELVHNFPKDMLCKVTNILKGLDNYDIKGLYGVKVYENKYNLAFEIALKYKLLFGYDVSKNVSVLFETKKDEPLLSINEVDSDEKISLINSVIKETIVKDNLIDNTSKSL